MRSTFSAGRIDRLDAAVALFSILLLTALGLTIARGDQVGLAITAFAPRDIGSIRPQIQITFDDPVTADVVASHFSIEPVVQGDFSAENQTIRFTPSAALEVGQVYTVRLSAGVASPQTDRVLKDDQVWSFTIRSPRVLYLGTDPNDQLVQNIFLVDPQNPQLQQQLTFSATGVIEYDPSPDGSQIAFSEFQQTGNNNLYLWDAATGDITPLFDCTNAICNSPVWSPNGQRIAFERSEIDPSGAGVGVSRVWLLDLKTSQVRPLLSDSQQIGYDPRWSPDGSKVALYSQSAGGIVIHDLNTNIDQTVPSSYGQMGEFSPDGRFMIFPRMVEVQDKAYAAHYAMIDVTSEFLTQTDTVPDSELFSDVEAVWLDTQTLIVARQAPFQSSAGGGIRPGPQLYTLNVETGEATPLFIDENYTNGNLVVSQTGDQLAFQRFELGRPGARTEVWMLDLATNEVTQLANNAMLPKWLP